MAVISGYHRVFVFPNFGFEEKKLKFFFQTSNGFYNYGLKTLLLNLLLVTFGYCLLDTLVADNLLLVVVVLEVARKTPSERWQVL